MTRVATLEKLRQMLASGWCLLLCLWLFGMALPAWASQEHVLVVYPETKAPYDHIFKTILKGIKVAEKIPVKAVVIESDQTSSDLHAQLQADEVTGIIALGTQSLKLVKSAKNLSKPVVVGAVLRGPKNPAYPTLSLIPGPQAIFTKVQHLLPNRNKIFTVYREGRDDWLIDRAHAVAKHKHLRFSATSARNTAEMAQAYLKGLDELERGDILWLSVGGRSLKWPVMQKLLDIAWRKGIIIISSHASDVKKGVLLSFMPDHEAMGKNLSELMAERIVDDISEQSQDSQRQAIMPAMIIDVAANLRVAEHLNIKFSWPTVRTFRFVYPPPSR